MIPEFGNEVAMEIKKSYESDGNEMNERGGTPSLCCGKGWLWYRGGFLPGMKYG